VNVVRQGDVYWIDFGPATGSAPAERHPCVVVQGDLFNRSRIATTVICLITSNLARSGAPGNVCLRKGDASLPKASVVNVSQVLTVDKDDLVERIGRLPAGTIDAIRSGLELLFERVSWPVSGD
jgi:mRNA interferase MazF